MSEDLLVDQLGRVCAAVGGLIGSVRAEQWSAPTPCTDWTVQRLVNHLIGMNRMFLALLDGAPPPQRGGDDDNVDGLAQAFAASAASLQAAFGRPGVLQHEFAGPLGVATGADRLQIRLYDLLAHGWDLARATGQQFDVPEEIAARSLAFVRVQLLEPARAGRFQPAQPTDDGAPAIEQLVAFLGRSVDARP